MQKQGLSNQTKKSGISALAMAQEYVGCVEATNDLSTNKDYMNGYGAFLRCNRVF